MQIEDPGVLMDSVRFYHEPDNFALKNLFVAPYSGVYHCTSEYVFQRKYLEASQIILIDAGKLTIEYKDEVRTAQAGSIVLIDCRFKHKYYAASDDLKMRWFHFAGNASQAYTQLLTDKYSFIIQNIAANPEIEKYCNEMIVLVKQTKPDAHVVSITIHRILAALMNLSDTQEKSEIELAIQATVSYIEENFTEKNIKLDGLAHSVALSPYYFLRKFKEFNHQTPHQYLLITRIRNAKAKLTTTTWSIEEIGAWCGFSSTSHFVTTFKKQTQLTPLQFRNIWRQS